MKEATKKAMEQSLETVERALEAAKVFEPEVFVSMMQEQQARAAGHSHWHFKPFDCDSDTAMAVVAPPAVEEPPWVPVPPVPGVPFEPG